jgi:U5 small nuclear ribonucleoprotein component
MEYPELIRNVAIVGHLHHGKTSLMDMLVQQTHEKNWQLAKSVRYTDTLVIEQERGLSIKTTPMSLVLSASSGKSYLLNLADTPGHVNFSDEVTTALRLADGVLLVVDVVEGLMMNTERLIRHACQEGLRVCLLLNKMDRLILELKLTPADAYHKLRHVLEELNQVLVAASQGQQRFAPEAGNVAFASTAHGWVFTLESFAALHAAAANAPLDPREFARRLWGDLYFHPESRAFRRRPPPARPGQPAPQRSFVQFVLAPLYKLYSHVLGEEPERLAAVLRDELGMQLRREHLRLNAPELLKLVMTGFFGRAGGLVDMLVAQLPSPVQAAPLKAERLYLGPQEGEAARAIRACDAEQGPTIVHVTKLFARPDCASFEAWGRVVSGVLRRGQRLLVLGEGYSPEDPEDSSERDAGPLALAEARYRVEVARARAGNWVLIEGLDEAIVKAATLVDAAWAQRAAEPVHIFRPLRFNTRSVLRVAIEPLTPSELPKMLDGLRKINKTYPLAVTKVEESGEHVVLGTGELYLDCILHDLRRMYAEIEVKVSDPVVSFCETCVETSSIKCYATTPNRENKLTMTAEPLERGLAEELEAGTLGDPRERATWERLQRQFEWDPLAARSIWAFGPEPDRGANVLLEDTLGQVERPLLQAARDSIVQGFQWATREGPLCEEPIRNVKFRLLGAEISRAPLQRSPGQLIPTARRVAYSAFLMATPRLMEPIYFVEIQSPAECVPAIYNVLQRRRGHVTHEAPKAGTPLHLVRAYLPAIESFGFETDLRTHTQGQAFGLSVFDHWAVVPGDPLDRSILLKPLEPAPTPHLAREFMVKTRRRKGLSDDVNAAKFFDEDLMAFLQAQATSQDGLATAAPPQLPI